MFRKSDTELTFNFDKDAGIVRIELLLRRAWVEIDSVFKNGRPDETLEGSVVDHRFNHLPAHSQIHSGDRCVDLREGSPDLFFGQPAARETNVGSSKPLPIIIKPHNGDILLDLHGDGGKGVGFIEPDRVLLNDESTDRFIDVLIHLMFAEARLDFDGLSFCFQKLHLVLECDLKDLLFSKAA